MAKKKDMELQCTCQDITKQEWDKLMKGHRPMSYQWLKRRIKRYLPHLYNELMLDYYNPYESATYRTKMHYILTHSSIEYFILK